MLILGLSFSHDAAACLLEDGKVVVAIQQERLTRKKHDAQRTMDNSSMIQYCLDAKGITFDEVDLVVSNIQSLSYGGVGLGSPLVKNFDIFDPYSDKHIFISHHLAHAYSAFSPSGQKESVVMVIDAAGSFSPGGRDFALRGPEMKAFLEGDQPKATLVSEAESYYYFSDEKIELLDRYFLSGHNSDLVYSEGIGMAYAIVSNYIFNDPLECGKVMGLAPYGDSSFYNNFDIIEHKNGEIVFNNTWQKNFDTPGFNMEKKHLAAKIQFDLEKALKVRAQKAMEKANTKNICYAGGVALNCVANDKVLNGMAKELFIQPASNDAGVALGCAYYGYSQMIKKNCHAKQTDDYKGKQYTPLEVKDSITKNKFVSVVKTESLIKEVAKRIEEGEIIAWFQGGSEFGPRSLGHRSILANPLLPNMKETLNKRVKHRELFRPFSPICPEENADTFFEIHRPSPFMLLSHQVKEIWKERLPAITHIDSSSRLQTLERSTNQRLHTLLGEFGKLTGVPILVNTSFNLMGEPIVETPDDAINCFLSTDIDALVLEDQLLVRQRNTDNVLDTHLPTLLPSVSLIAEYKQDQHLFGITDGKNLAPLSQDQFKMAEKITHPETVDEFISSQNQTEFEVFKELCIRLEQGNYLRWLKKTRTHST